MKKNFKKIIYDVEKFKSLLKKYQNSKFFVITDQNIFNKQGSFIEEIFKGYKIEFILVIEGERVKNLNEFDKAINKIIEIGVSRTDFIVAFGGGSIGDLAGFIAATILRGINYINIPTTLLSMVDSSIGGKTGINTDKGKNLIGAFKNGFVLIHLPLLKTLPDKELVNGYGEIVKTAFIRDRKIFKLLKENKLSEELVKRTQKVKLKVIKRDYYEKDLRKILNFGHTFGHAIEKFSNYEVSHGEAIFQGMEIAFKIGIELNISKESDLKILQDLFNTYNLKSYKGNASDLIKEIKYDKKENHGFVDFIFIKKRAVIYNIKVDFLYELLR